MLQNGLLAVRVEFRVQFYLFKCVNSVVKLMFDLAYAAAAAFTELADRLEGLLTTTCFKKRPNLLRLFNYRIVIVVTVELNDLKCTLLLQWVRADTRATGPRRGSPVDSPRRLVVRAASAVVNDSLR